MEGLIEKDCALSYPSNNMTSVIESAYVSKAAGIGIISGLLIVFLINFVLSFEYESLKRKVKIKIKSDILLQKSLILLILILSLPLVIALLIGAYLYKLLCALIIKRKDRHFAGFLDSFDVFWSLEDDTTKSIINVLGIIESESSQELVDNIKEKLQNIVQNNDTEKFFYRRSEEYGFYYWRKCCYVDTSQYVRVVDVSNVDILSVTDLEEIMTEVSYQPLPFNDEGLFQILVTNQALTNSDEGNCEYGIIFRIHHAVGDGVALIEFLCQALADRKDDEAITFCMPETYTKSNKKTLADLLTTLTKLFDMPRCLIDGILREPDSSSLHGPPLTGKKIYKWVEPSNNLFHMVKSIKENVEDANFSDILATALSCGFQEYFKKEIDRAPSNVAVILPIRFPAVKNLQVKLENNFTVSILDLPVGGDLDEIKMRFNELRCSVDPLTNYYILKLCSIFPKEILLPMFNSSQATMVFSNLPGPKVLSICGGNLKSLVFFVPNKGNTGLGVTALCYGGILRLAAMADSALVSSPEQLGVILDGMVKEIERLHDKYVRNGEGQTSNGRSKITNLSFQILYFMRRSKTKTR